MFKSLLDNDMYKFAMQQFVFHRFGEEIEVTYSLTNRNTKILKLPRCLDVTELIKELDHLFSLSITEDEIKFLDTITTKSYFRPTPIKVFKSDYLDWLKIWKCGKTTYNIEYQDDELLLTFTGPWVESILYEVPVMAIISELVTNDIYKRLDPRFLEELRREGVRLLEDKIRFTLANRSLRFSDFGTRRRASHEWHDYILKRFSLLQPEYHFAGTSNLYFAKKYGLTPIGTMAHELSMVLAGLMEIEGKSPTNAYSWLMKEWVREYGSGLGILLPDTFTSKWLFENHGIEVVNMWEGVRHDSGDPIEFGNNYIKLCLTHGVDPKNRTIVFSDGLNLDMAMRILDNFRDKVWVAFGIGTNLTHDIGLIPLNIVIKAKTVRKNHDGYLSTVNLVKLSDNPGKHAGNDIDLERYKSVFNVS